MQLQLDLHGKSLEEAKKLVLSTIKRAYQENHKDVRLITGRGNHPSADGTRGKLYLACEQWLQEPDIQFMIRNINKGDGHYRALYWSLIQTIDHVPVVDDFLCRPR
ncbi:MAG: Smr/MutS family protein [Gammaproteobacteria bacterium]